MWGAQGSRSLIEEERRRRMHGQGRLAGLGAGEAIALDTQNKSLGR